MTATSTVPIDTRYHDISRGDDIADDAYDPLPDETVLKTGWLNKKGRRGVILLIVSFFDVTALETKMVCTSIG